MTRKRPGLARRVHKDSEIGPSGLPRFLETQATEPWGTNLDAKWRQLQTGQDVRMAVESETADFKSKFWEELTSSQKRQFKTRIKKLLSDSGIGVELKLKWPEAAERINDFVQPTGSGGRYEYFIRHCRHSAGELYFTFSYREFGFWGLRISTDEFTRLILES